MFLIQFAPAEADEDYESINSCPLGPFSYSTPQHCFVFTVNDDSDTEDTEMFTLEIEEEPSHVKVENQTVLVFIESEDGELALVCSSIMQNICV